MSIDWATIPGIITVLIALAVIIIIVLGLTGHRTVYELLSKTEVARGLITFLIALITIAMAIILVLYGLTNTAPDFKDRFGLTKEIFTFLIGILGTIVGFYFGLSPGAQIQNLQISPLYITEKTPPKGQSTTIIGFITGGKPPYSYSLTFTPTDIQPIDNTTPNGYIEQRINIPAGSAPPPSNTTVRFQISVRDNDNRIINYSGNNTTFTVA